MHEIEWSWEVFPGRFAFTYLTLSQLFGEGEQEVEVFRDDSKIGQGIVCGGWLHLDVILSLLESGKAFPQESF